MESGFALGGPRLRSAAGSRAPLRHQCGKPDRCRSPDRVAPVRSEVAKSHRENQQAIEPKHTTGVWSVQTSYQPFAAFRAQARDSAPVATPSATSTTGTTLTLFQ